MNAISAQIPVPRLQIDHYHTCVRFDQMVKAGRGIFAENQMAAEHVHQMTLRFSD